STNSGLELDTQTNNTIVKWNTFLHHTTHATDDGSSNVFMYNYFDDHTTPDANGDGYVDTPYTIAGTATNTDPFPIAASNNIDNDLDGLTNYEELILGTDPEDADSDDDLLLDGVEVNILLTDPLNNDSDSDSLTDGEEVSIYFSDPLNNDTDDDSINDGIEVLVYGTDPTKSDTEDDGMDDLWEITYGTNPLINDTSADPDTDGLTNIEEYNYNTDPLDSDSDDDTYLDGEEIDAGTDPLDPDSFPLIYDPRAILEDPVSIVILATSGVTTAAIAGGLAIRSFFNKLTEKFLQITQACSEWQVLKDALSGQVSEVASTISKKRDYLEECPVCDAAKIGPYCYVCGTTLSYEEAELVKKKDSKKK
ncbi:MAG: hypothetical protein FK733_02395, partial [Asgard group archaeon]|nr:hypothetical protein [Asgard group archaeon]